MIAHILHKSLSLKKLLNDCISAKASSCQSFAYGKEEYEWDQSEVACSPEGMKRRADLVIAMAIKERQAEFNFSMVKVHPYNGDVGKKQDCQERKRKSEEHIVTFQNIGI